MMGQAEHPEDKSVLRLRALLSASSPNTEALAGVLSDIEQETLGKDTLADLIAHLCHDDDGYLVLAYQIALLYGPEAFASHAH